MNSIPAMKTGSSLNPYAASYVPLSKREVGEEKSKDIYPSQELQRRSENFWYGHQPDNMLAQGMHQNVLRSHAHDAGASPTAESSRWRGQHSGEFYASSSRYPNKILEKSHSFEESDMDLAYLLMMFPGISEESLSDVYLANRCDLDAAVDMLNQLELYPDDSSDKLPDTLDIGDVPESGPSIELSLKKLKDVKAEGGASSSASSNLPSAG